MNECACERKVFKRESEIKRVVFMYEYEFAHERGKRARVFIFYESTCMIETGRIFISHMKKMTRDSFHFSWICACERL